MDYLENIDRFVPLSAVGEVSQLASMLAKYTGNQLAELSYSLAQSLPVPHKAQSPFSFVGNSQLSGLPFPCAGLGCRSDNISELALFASLYADQVVVYNQFSEINFRSSNNEDFARSVGELAFLIGQILMLRPLIDRGICAFIEPEHFHFCDSCFQQAIASLKAIYFSEI